MTIQDLVAMATALLEAQAEVMRLDAALKDAKAKVTLLSETSVPCALQELELQSFTLESGKTIALKKEVYASVSAESMPACVEWLEAHEADGIVKREVSLRFGKDDGEMVRQLVEDLRQQGLVPDVTFAIHASTLKAFIKERLEQALPIDLELFHVRAVFVAKIS